MDESFSKSISGIDRAFFDADTERFAELVGRLTGLCGSPLKPEAYDLLVEIKEFLAGRFEYEHHVMACNSYRDTSIHQQQHKLLLETLSWSIRSAQEQDCIPWYLCDFLTDWFQFHLEELDFGLCGLQAPASDEPYHPASSDTA